MSENIESDKYTPTHFELEKEINEFLDDCFASEKTIYEAFQFNDTLSFFNLHFAMKADDEVSRTVIRKYFERLEKESELEFYEGISLSDYLNDDNMKLSREEVRETLREIIGEREKNMTEYQNKWVCAPNIDIETWRTCEFFDTKNEAIAAGRKAIKEFLGSGKTEKMQDTLGYYPEENEVIDTFAVGQCEVSAFIDVDSFLERIQEDTYDQCGEIAENYLNDVTIEDKEELEKIIYEWFERHDYVPNFYTIVNIEEVGR